MRFHRILSEAIIVIVLLALIGIVSYFVFDLFDFQNAEKISVTVRMVASVVTAVLALMVYRAARVLARVDIGNGLDSGWLQVNEILLSDDRNLAIFTAMEKGEPIDAEDMRSRTLLHLILNMVHSEWAATRKGLLSRNYSMPTLERFASLWLPNRNYVERVLRHSGYETAFVRDFIRVMDKLDTA